MTITVTKADIIWQAGDRTIWQLQAGDGASYKTYSKIIAGLGTFEVETYDKNGDTFVRQLKPDEKRFLPQGAPAPSQTAREPFKADPEKQVSIEWQSSIGSAVEAVRDWHMLYQPMIASGDVLPGAHLPTLDEYKNQIVNTAITFAQTVSMRPSEPIEAPAPQDRDEIIIDLGDHARAEYDDPELPPVENYAGMQS